MLRRTLPSWHLIAHEASLLSSRLAEPFSPIPATQGIPAWLTRGRLFCLLKTVPPITLFAPAQVSLISYNRKDSSMRPLIVMSGENIDWCHTVIRMLMYLVGVAILALGMSLQTASGLGVAALTCFATTLSMLTSKTLGFWITATYVAYIAAQLAILRREESSNRAFCSSSFSRRSSAVSLTSLWRSIRCTLLHFPRRSRRCCSPSLSLHLA